MGVPTWEVGYTSAMPRREDHEVRQGHVDFIFNHKVRHPLCVYNKLDWSLYTCLTQLYGGRDMYNLLHKDQPHVSALFIGHLQVDKWDTLVSSYTQLVWVHNTCEISYLLHPWPPHCIQPTQVECSCLPMFLIYQPEDGQWKGPKHVVGLYVINYTYIYHHTVVLDRYTNSNRFHLQLSRNPSWSR